MGFSGGIWILWKDSVEVDIIGVHAQVIHMEVKQGNKEFLCFAVYASPQS